MVMTNAERMKKYRKKIKKDKAKYEAMKAKDCLRYHSKKEKLTETNLAKFRAANKLRQQKCRHNKKNNI